MYVFLNSVDHPPSRMLFEEDGTVLKIRRLCKDCDIRQSGRITDLMVIQCNASNEHGYAFGQGYVNVFSKYSYHHTGSAHNHKLMNIISDFHYNIFYYLFPVSLLNSKSEDPCYSCVIIVEIL